MKYSDTWSPNQSARSAAESQLLRLEENRTRETLASFRDVAELLDKLQEARAELRRESLKLRLLDKELNGSGNGGRARENDTA